MRTFCILLQVVLHIPATVFQRVNNIAHIPTFVRIK